MVSTFYTELAAAPHGFHLIEVLEQRLSANLDEMWRRVRRDREPSVASYPSCFTNRRRQSDPAVVVIFCIFMKQRL